MKLMNFLQLHNLSFSIKVYKVIKMVETVLIEHLRTYRLEIDLTLTLSDKILIQTRINVMYRGPCLIEL